MPLWNVREHVIGISKAIDSHPIGLPTGLRPLDELTRGLTKGELVIIAGRPGMGKSSLMVDIVNNVSASGPPLVFSMEMGRDLFIERQVTNLARVPFTRAKSGRLQDSEKKRLLEQATELSKRDIYVEGTSLITPAGVEQTLMEARDNKIPLNLVCIDHLHYMKMHKGEWSIGDEIAQITKYLKALARTYDVPLLLLCQLNRGPEYREDHRPMLNDLRDSGSIEQDADQVWFLYRDSYYSRSAQETTEAEIIVAKQRNGPPGTVKVMWSGPLMSFSEPVKMNLTDF